MLTRVVRTLKKRVKPPKEWEVSVCDRQAYLYAKAKLKFKRKDVDNWTGYNKIVTRMFKIIGEHAVNNPEGVYIRDLGYFGALQYQRTAAGAKGQEKGSGIVPYMNAHTDGAVMSLSFLPIPERRLTALQVFLMDGTFSGTVKKKFIQNLFNGMKYRNNAPLFFKNK